MRVVDTSAWIEWLTGSPLRATLAQEIPERTRCVVPTIVQLELAKWLVRESGEAQADEMLAYTQKCVIALLNTRIALRAVDLHRHMRYVSIFRRCGRRQRRIPRGRACWASEVGSNGLHSCKPRQMALYKECGWRCNRDDTLQAYVLKIAYL